MRVPFLMTAAAVAALTTSALAAPAAVEVPAQVRPVPAVSTTPSSASTINTSPARTVLTRPKWRGFSGQLELCTYYHLADDCFKALSTGGQAMFDWYGCLEAECVRAIQSYAVYRVPPLADSSSSSASGMTVTQARPAGAVDALAARPLGPIVAEGGKNAGPVLLPGAAPGQCFIVRVFATRGLFADSERLCATAASPIGTEVVTVRRRATSTLTSGTCGALASKPEWSSYDLRVGTLGISGCPEGNATSMYAEFDLGETQFPLISAVLQTSTPLTCAETVAMVYSTWQSHKNVTSMDRLADQPVPSGTLTIDVTKWLNEKSRTTKPNFAIYPTRRATTCMNPLNDLRLVVSRLKSGGV